MPFEIIKIIFGSMLVTPKAVRADNFPDRKEHAEGTARCTNPQLIIPIKIPDFRRHLSKYGLCKGHKQILWWGRICFLQLDNFQEVVIQGAFVTIEISPFCIPNKFTWHLLLRKHPLIVRIDDLEIQDPMRA